MPVMDLGNCGMAQSITFKDIDCTIEGGQFNFSAAGIEGAEQAVAKEALEMLLVALGSAGSFVDYFALQRGGAQVERIGRREADFDHATVILQTINAVGKEFAGEKNIAGGSLGMHVKAMNVSEAKITADGSDLELAGATRALKGTAYGLDGHITGGIFEVHTGGHGFYVHVAEHVGDVHFSGVIVDLELGVFRDVNLVVGAHVVRRNIVSSCVGRNIHAIAHLLSFDFYVVTGASGNHHYFGLGPGFHGDHAVWIVNGDHRMGVNFEVLLLAAGGRSGGSHAAN